MLYRFPYSLPRLILGQPCEPGIIVSTLQRRKSRLSKSHLVIQPLVIECLLNARTEDSVAAKQGHNLDLRELTVL